MENPHFKWREKNFGKFQGKNSKVGNPNLKWRIPTLSGESLSGDFENFGKFQGKNSKKNPHLKWRIPTLSGESHFKWRFPKILGNWRFQQILGNFKGKKSKVEISENFGKFQNFGENKSKVGNPHLKWRFQKILKISGKTNLKWGIPT